MTTFDECMINNQFNKKRNDTMFFEENICMQFIDSFKLIILYYLNRKALFVEVNG